MLKSIGKLNEIEEKYGLDALQVNGIYYAAMETYVRYGTEHDVRLGFALVLKKLSSFASVPREQHPQLVEDVVEHYQLLVQEMKDARERRDVRRVLDELEDLKEEEAA